MNKGFNTTNIPVEFCLIHGELAELFEAWKKEKGNIGEELADVLIYLLGLAEILGIDAEKEVMNKVKINEGRVYKQVNNHIERVESEGNTDE
jgi:NTP pyrophosphatase (non-canonical NTP hydrolase)